MIEQIVIVGFGCIGQAALPLPERAWPRAAITVVDRVLDGARRQLADQHRLFHTVVGDVPNIVALYSGI